MAKQRQLRHTEDWWGGGGGKQGNAHINYAQYQVKVPLVSSRTSAAATDIAAASASASAAVVAATSKTRDE